MLYVSTDPREVAQLLAAEIAADAAKFEHRQRELVRHRGVNWSGLGPEPMRARSLSSLQATAETKLAARRRWSGSSKGRILAAIAACQAAAQRAHAVGERARAGLARDEPFEWCGQALKDLSNELQMLATSLEETRLVIGDS